jgi:hypothetical protein
VRLDRGKGRARETLETKVAVGTSISAGCEVLYPGELPGRRIVVIEVEQGWSRIALGISAAVAPLPAAETSATQNREYLTPANKAGRARRECMPSGCSRQPYACQAQARRKPTRLQWSRMQARPSR